MRRIVPLGACLFLGGLAATAIACSDTTTEAPTETPEVDAGEEPDSGPIDAGGATDATADTGPKDAGPKDAGPPPLGAVTRVTTGSAHTCALFSSGAVKCWGSNKYGQLGLGDTSNRGDALGEMGSSLPTVDLGGTAVAVSAGGYHTCALLQGGAVKCWGLGGNGQLGLGYRVVIGDQPGEMGATLSAVDLGGTAVAIAAGFNHTCALLAGGGVKCWGTNSSGELGYGDTRERGADFDMGNNLAIVSLGGRPTVDLVAGASYTCALLDDGTVKCWGNNDGGQLGRGDTLARGDSYNEMGIALQAINLGGKRAKSIAAATAHVCAILEDDSLKCWGLNGDGQLGLGDANGRGDNGGELGTALPAVNLGGVGAASVAGGSNYTCAALTDGAVKCWGANGRGQLGLENVTPRGANVGDMAALPALNFGGKKATAVSAGFGHTCALLADATVKCWGYNSSGQLGVGDTSDRGDNAGEMTTLPAVSLGR